MIIIIIESITALQTIGDNKKKDKKGDKKKKDEKPKGPSVNPADNVPGAGGGEKKEEEKKPKEPGI